MRSFRKATSSGVMVMFAPGTTRMRFLGAAVRLLLEDDDGAAGGRVVVIEDAGRVDPGLFAGAAHLVAVRVVTELAAHRDLRAEAAICTA